MPYEDRYFWISRSLFVKGRVAVLLALVHNLDAFAWSPYKVIGVDLEFIVHKLNVDPYFHLRRKN